MGKKITISVVMPIYNREKYLVDAIESIIGQTYGLKNIELIMVDDGSTDGSGAICDAYREKYPNNCVVIHQKNQGPSRARNAGVQAVTGEWINFLDSDDKMSLDAFAKVARFIKKHKDETDVVAIPVYFFGAREGEHPLNYKFHDGTRVVDLETDWKNPQLFINSAFMRAETVKKVAFNDVVDLPASEDAREMVRVLLEKKTIGFLCSTKYWYRRHDNTLMNNAKDEKKWYLDTLRDFSFYLLDYAQEKCGYVPKFVQNTVMYEMQWRLFQGKVRFNTISEEESMRYKEMVLALCDRIDADVILSQRKMWRQQKTFLLYRKNNQFPHVGYDEEGEEIFEYGDTKCGLSPNLLPVRVSFAKLTDDILTLEGWMPHFLYELEEKPELFVAVNGEKLPVDTHELEVGVQLLGEVIFRKYNYRVDIPLKNYKRASVKFIAKMAGKEYEVAQLVPEKYFPLDKNSRYSYKKFPDWIMIRHRGELILKKKNFCLGEELVYLGHLLYKKQRGTKKAFLVRLLYGFLKVFTHKEIWLISDRIMKADDNGEAFFKYMMQHKSDNRKVYFAISKKSEDYERLKQIGPVVDFFSIKHRMIYLLSKYNISSQGEQIIIYPFHGYHYGYRSLDLPKFVFLQHGVTKDDISDWLNRWNKDIYGFITTGEREHQSILDGDYYYTDKNVWLTGFCRYDYLEDRREKLVLVMPTWRNHLLNGVNQYTGQHTLKKGFTESEYFLFYNGLINNERLLGTLKQYGYRLKFVPHPLLVPHMDLFNKNDEVIFSSSKDTYRNMFAEGSLLVTDYSSTAFDFAYLGKPIVYCQFDKDVFFGGSHTYKQGYFEYERDGFGEVEYTIEDTVNRIIEYVEHDCKLKPQYRQRIDEAFTYHDRDNCKRLYEKLVEMNGV